MGHDETHMGVDEALARSSTSYDHEPWDKTGHAEGPIHKMEVRPSGAPHARLETEMEELKRRVVELAEQLTKLQAQYKLHYHVIQSGPQSG